MGLTGTHSLACRVMYVCWRGLDGATMAKQNEQEAALNQAAQHVAGALQNPGLPAEQGEKIVADVQEVLEDLKKALGN